MGEKKGRKYVNRKGRIGTQLLRKLRAEAIRDGAVIVVTDDRQQGFQARAYPTGRVSFQVVYRVDGRQRRYSFGEWGKIWTPDRARDEAEAIRAGARDKENPRDPLKSESDRKAVPLVREFSGRYLSEWACPPRLKPSTAREYARIVQVHIVPAFEGLRMNEVSRKHVTVLHSELSERPYMANRVLAVCSALFSYAEEMGEIPERSNPCSRVRPFREHKRERILKSSELAALGQALRRAETEGLPVEPERWKKGATKPHKICEPESPSAIDAIRVILLTGARRGEILNLKWSEVDFEGGCLRLEDSKTGEKVIPLGGAALAILKGAAERGESSKWVFPGRTPDRPWKDLKGPWHRVRAAAGLPNLRMHDLRHVFAGTAAGNTRYGLQVLGAVLGHRQAGTTMRYANVADDPRWALAEEVSAILTAKLEGEEPAEVVSFSEGGKQ